MDYVGICYFTEIGRCLCGPAAAGSGKSLVEADSAHDSVSAARLSPAVATLGGAGASSASPAGAGAGRAASAASGLDSGEAVLAFLSVFDTSQPGSPANASGGAPAPEVHAGLGLILALGTVAILKRRRGRALGEPPGSPRPG